MKAIVCGSRASRDEALVFATLDGIQAKAVPGSGPLLTCIVTGAASGVDYLAEKWAKSREVPYRGHPAPWHTHGSWCRCSSKELHICRAAGPWRNGEMLRRENVPAFPVGLLIAFSGGDGTANMVSLARAAAVPVLEVEK